MSLYEATNAYVLNCGSQKKCKERFELFLQATHEKAEDWQWFQASVSVRGRRFHRILLDDSCRSLDTKWLEDNWGTRLSSCGEIEWVSGGSPTTAPKHEATKAYIVNLNSVEDGAHCFVEFLDAHGHSMVDWQWFHASDLTEGRMFNEIVFDQSCKDLDPDMLSKTWGARLTADGVIVWTTDLTPDSTSWKIFVTIDANVESRNNYFQFLDKTGASASDWQWIGQDCSIPPGSLFSHIVFDKPCQALPAGKLYERWLNHLDVGGCVSWWSNDVIKNVEKIIFDGGIIDLSEGVIHLPSDDAEPESDMVVSPKHYTNELSKQLGIEVIDISNALNLNGNRFSMLRYVLRAGIKDPKKEIEDLEKIIQYVNFEIRRIKGEPISETRRTKTNDS